MKENKTTVVKKTVKSGITFGSALAMVISYTTWQSVGWAIFHGCQMRYSHSPILLGIPNSEIYCFDDGHIHNCAYEETESYRVTEMFINNREVLLKRLLEDN